MRRPAEGALARDQGGGDLSLRGPLDHRLRPACRRAYTHKSVSPVDIPSVLRQAATGAVYHVPSAPAPREQGPAVPTGPELTPRETTILRAVADGRTTKAISKDLWLSEHTVKFHLTNIYRKLGVSNRSAAVRYAYEHALTQPSTLTRSTA